MFSQPRQDDQRGEQVGGESPLEGPAAGPHEEPLEVSGEPLALSRREAVALGMAGALTLLWPSHLLSRTRGPSLLRVGESHPEHDRELSNVFLEGGFTVPEGQTWRCGPNVRTNGNALVHGRLVMRPGAALKFEGVNPERFVGGGVEFGPAVQHDIGLWVEHDGVLDIQGTPKVGWNRSGRDPSWRPGDEYYIAPTAPGDITVRRWRPGEPIPRAHPDVPPAEVANVTRDILIEGTERGPAHIHVHAHRPQILKHFALRHMGVSNSKGEVLGRYVLHLHKGLGGSNGTVVEGVAAVHSQNHVFVPHESHGITLRDLVSVFSRGAGLWWDEGDRTDDLMAEHLLILAPAVGRPDRRHDGIRLGGGVNLTLRHSVVAGAASSRLSNGFDWPSKAASSGPAVWVFDEGNVAHNCRGSGSRVWQNQGQPHVVRGLVAYHNQEAGASHGAYGNRYAYDDCLFIGNPIVIHASAGANVREGRRGSRSVVPAVWTNIRVRTPGAPALIFVRHNTKIPYRLPYQFINWELEGTPKVLVNPNPRGDTHGPQADFIAGNVRPEDIVIAEPFHRDIGDTRFRIQDRSGRNAWEITLDMQHGRKVVREIDPFFHGRV